MREEERKEKSEAMKKANAEKKAKALAAEKDIEGSNSPEKEVDNTVTSAEISASINKKETQAVIEKKVAGKKDLSWKNEKVTITLHEMEGMPSYQFVGLNGETYLIKVGEPVDVPKAILRVLEDAVIETKEYTPVVGMPGAFHVKDKIIRRFAISTRL
jgi:hypothetical protein